MLVSLVFEFELVLLIYISQILFYQTVLSMDKYCGFTLFLFKLWYCVTSYCRPWYQNTMVREKSISKQGLDVQWLRCVYKYVAISGHASRRSIIVISTISTCAMLCSISLFALYCCHLCSVVLAAVICCLS
jgi:hypothetical protein